jgi:hypothetical protein
MRLAIRLFCPIFLGAVCASQFAHAAAKLQPEERIEILRGMLSEYGTVKVLLPKSKKPLPVDGATGGYDKAKWKQAHDEAGPAARQGDLVQITKVDIHDDRIVLEINGGFKGGRKWYQNVEVGMGGSGRTTPIGGTRTTVPTGTALVLELPKDYESMSVAQVKKMLAPVLDFEKQRSATENYIDTLPPEIQKAIKEQKPAEGMDKEQLIMALGRPRSKSREVKDGVEYEDWVYGQPPGKITFVTFDGDKVVRIKETYAGLGGSTAAPLPPQP